MCVYGGRTSCAPELELMRCWELGLGSLGVSGLRPLPGPPHCCAKRIPGAGIWGQKSQEQDPWSRYKQELGTKRWGGRRDPRNQGVGGDGAGSGIPGAGITEEIPRAGFQEQGC